MSEPLLKYRQPTAPQDILTEAVPAKLYTEGSGLNLARAALFGVELDGVKDIVELLRAYRGGRPNSLIMGGPMGWSWYATLDEAHHGALTGPANAHRHSDLANIGIDDHHARDHATRHDPGEADALSTAYFRTDGSLGLAGDLKPDVDATRNIGADLLRWRNLRLSHGALIGGNVGIGTDSPANKLHVVAPIATQFARFSNTYDSGYVLLGGNNNRGRLLLGGGSTGSLLHTTGGWQWDTQLNIMGAVGIGTNSPTTFTLQIAGSTGPNADAVSDLGGVSLRWRDLRLSRDIYMGGTLQSGSMDAARITTGRFGKSRLEWTADKLLKGAGAGADPTEIDAAFALAIFGDGSDDDVTITVDTTLTRDMFYNNLTVNAGITLKTGGYRIFVKGTLTNNGTIANNGVGASAQYGGAGASGATVRGGGGGGNGALDHAGVYGGGGGGGGGIVFITAKTLNNAGTMQANGGNGANGVGTPSVTNANGSAGGGVSSSLGGNGGSSPPTAWGGGGGGGIAALSKTGGRHGVLPGFDTQNKEAHGGGGGGRGGAASLSGGGAGTSGGGGGGGGALVLIYNSATWSTEQANGGTGGTGTGTGGTGGTGSAGNVIKIANA